MYKLPTYSSLSLNAKINYRSQVLKLGVSNVPMAYAVYEYGAAYGKFYALPIK